MTKKGFKISIRISFFLIILVCLPLLAACGGGSNDGPILEPNEVLSEGYVFRRVENEWGDGYELVSFRYYGEQSRGDVLNVPSHVEGKPVIGLSGADETSLSAVILPDTLVYIKGSFRHCVNLTSLQIPASVIQITGGSFLPESDWGHGCPKLVQAENGFLYMGNWVVGNDKTKTDTEQEQTPSLREGTLGIADGVSLLSLIDDDDKLVIPEGIKHIGKLNFFKENSISDWVKELVLPESLETIGESAFWAVVNTKSPIVLKNVKSIGKNAFSHGKYGELILPETVEYIGRGAFEDSSFDKICFGAGVQRCEKGAAHSAKIGELSIPTSLLPMITSHEVDGWTVNYTSIHTLRLTDGAVKDVFRNATVKALILEEGVTSIAAKAFEGYTALETVEVKSAETYIPYSAFVTCEHLKDVTAPAEVFSSIAKEKLERAHVISGSIKALDFAYTPRLQEIVIAPEVSVDPDAFSRCAALTAATVPLSVLSALPKAQIMSLTVTDGTALDADTLAGFTALEVIGLPKTLLGLGADTFRDATGLQAVYFDGTLADWAKIRFANGAANPLSVAKDLYIGGELVTAVSGLTLLSPYAFYGYQKLASLDLSGLMFIPESAFAGCTGLVTLTVPASVGEIGPNAFLNCTALESVIFASTEGWMRYENAEDTGSEIFPVYLENAENAAETLVVTYVNYVWQKGLE
ncbi:MAG: leucine-rich repeat protein [Clostridia bacterium]|nr:leucine-rich repeat protein [Clostridia bacterium]